MPVELERTDGRHWHFQLGQVEKWVVLTCGALFVSGLVWFANNVTTRLDEQARAMALMTTQQAVANAQLLALTGQLTDIPQLRRDVVELNVRVDSLEEGHRELRQTRGAR